MFSVVIMQRASKYKIIKRINPITGPSSLTINIVVVVVVQTADP